MGISEIISDGIELGNQKIKDAIKNKIIETKNEEDNISLLISKLNEYNETNLNRVNEIFDTSTIRYKLNTVGLTKNVYYILSSSTVDEFNKKVDEFINKILERICQTAELKKCFKNKFNEIICYVYNKILDEAPPANVVLQAEMIRKMDGCEKNIISEIRKNNSKSDVVNQTELRINKWNLSSKKNHYCLPVSDIDINNVFIDGIYRFHSVDISWSDKEMDEIPPAISNCIEILKKQGFLLLQGGYGKGKTMLSLQIERKLLIDDYHVIFIAAHSIGNEIESYLSIEDLLLTKRKTCIILDAIDALCFSDDNMNYLFDLVANPELKENGNIIFLFTSRPYYKIGSGNKDFISLYFAINYLNNFPNEEFLYVEIKGFENKDVDTFMGKLSPKGCQKILNNTNLKKWYKKIHTSYCNPLFVYFLGDYYYRNSCTLPITPYDLYLNFVERTVNGRYNSATDQDFVYKITAETYREILHQLACEMLDKEKLNIDYEGEDPYSYDSSNYQQFSIELSRLKDSVKNYIANLDLNANEYSDALNCFFFKAYRNANEIFFCFSDVNIMCFLAAESIFNKLNSFSKSGKLFEKSLPSYFLQPQTMDFLISKLRILQKEDKVKIDDLLFYISKKVGEYNKKAESNIEEVKLQILLRIIFVKFFEDSYSIPEHSHFFKELDELYKKAKLLEINGSYNKSSHRYLFERYFMDCTFNDAVFRRMNLKNYNFQNSTIKNSEFTQCKLCDNRFTKCKINHTTFSLNIIENVEFENSLKSNNCFNNCNFQGGEIIVQHTLKDENLIFNTCTLNGSVFKTTRSHSVSYITFTKCIIQNLILRECVNLHIKFIQCIFEGSISNINSKIFICNLDSLPEKIEVEDFQNAEHKFLTRSEDVF